jgi:small multidrug resistance family-3 protein
MATETGAIVACSGLSMATDLSRVIALIYDMRMIRAAALFFLTAFFEIAGCYLLFLIIRHGKPVFLAIPALASLTVFACLLTLHPQDSAGRIYAAYGGIYIVASLVWMQIVERKAAGLLGYRPSLAVGWLRDSLLLTTALVFRKNIDLRIKNIFRSLRATKTKYSRISGHNAKLKFREAAAPPLDIHEVSEQDERDFFCGELK